MGTYALTRACRYQNNPPGHVYLFFHCNMYVYFIRTKQVTPCGHYVCADIRYVRSLFLHASVSDTSQPPNEDRCEGKQCNVKFT